MTNLTKSYSKASRGLDRLSAEFSSMLRKGGTAPNAAIEAALSKVNVAKGQMAKATMAARSAGTNTNMQGRQLTLLEAAAHQDPDISNPAKMQLHALLYTAADHLANIATTNERLMAKVTVLLKRLGKLAEQFNSQIPRAGDMKSADPQAYITSGGMESESWIGLSTQARLHLAQAPNQGLHATNGHPAFAQTAVQEQQGSASASTTTPIPRGTELAMPQSGTKSPAYANPKGNKDHQAAIAAYRGSGKGKKNKKDASKGNGASTDHAKSAASASGKDNAVKATVISDANSHSEEEHVIWKGIELTGRAYANVRILEAIHGILKPKLPSPERIELWAKKRDGSKVLIGTMALGGKNDGKFVGRGLDQDLPVGGRKIEAARQSITDSEDRVIEKIAAWQHANRGNLPSLGEFTRPEKEGGLGQREFFRDFKVSLSSARGKPDEKIYSNMLYELGFDPK